MWFEQADERRVDPVDIAQIVWPHQVPIVMACKRAKLVGVTPAEDERALAAQALGDGCADARGGTGEQRIRLHAVSLLLLLRRD